MPKNRFLPASTLSNINGILASIKILCDADINARDYSIKIWISELEEKELGSTMLARIINLINQPGMQKLYGTKFDICYDYGAPWDAEIATTPERVGIKLTLI